MVAGLLPLRATVKASNTDRAAIRGRPVEVPTVRVQLLSRVPSRLPVVGGCRLGLHCPVIPFRFYRLIVGGRQGWYWSRGRRRGCCWCRRGHCLLLQEAPCAHVTRRNRCHRFGSHEHDQGQGCVHGGNRSIFSWRFFSFRSCRSFSSRSIWPSSPLCAASSYRARALAAKVGQDAQPSLLVGRGL